MQKRNGLWKKIGARGLVLLFCLAAVLGSLLLLKHRRQEHFITKAQAAKVLAYACGGEEVAVQKQEGSYWYTSYTKYIEEQQLFDVKNPSKRFTCKDMEQVLVTVGVPKDTYKKNPLAKGVWMTGQAFMEALETYQSYFPCGQQLTWEEFAVVGTPKSMQKPDEVRVYTSKGKYGFVGVVVDSYLDKTVRSVCYQNEILLVGDVLLDEAVYKNIWIKESSGQELATNIYGTDRTFPIEQLEQPVANMLADLTVKDGKVREIATKTDTITGNVLSVTDSGIEIQGYGVVPLDEAFMIYDIQNGFAVKKEQDIIVGYDLQSFIVAEGKICGAVIQKPLQINNIRVIIKTTGYTSIFHEEIRVTSDKDFTVQTGDTMTRVKAGEEQQFSKENETLSGGRVTLIPDEGAEIRVLNVQRNGENPTYEGRMELMAADEGIVLINDIAIESYLKRVVPSEMPPQSHMEALKVQAICARSYAYTQLTNTNYSMYGAHVDDSTMYQVYNNTHEYASTNQAIADTKGRILSYQGEVVKTYYYSTSCGATTDIRLWGSEPDDYPYYKSVFVNASQKALDLTNEEQFRTFIMGKDERDFDADKSLYRWEFTAEIAALSENFNNKLQEKYHAAPQKLLTQQEDGSFASKDITTVGTIMGITVNERAPGGAIKSLTVSGTKHTVRIESESLLRALFGMADVEMTTNTGTRKMAVLPSSFCIFTPVYDGERLAGFYIRGGGYGHGIGMSQNAADAMAISGMNYMQILSFFYPGTKIL